MILCAAERWRRRAAAATADGVDLDAGVLRRARAVEALALEMLREYPSERAARGHRDAVRERRAIEARMAARVEARAKAKAWRERVRVKGSEDALAPGSGAEEFEAKTARLDAELAARRRAREAREKKPPMTGASDVWVRADEYLNSVLRKDASTAHPVESETIVDVVPTEASEDYPPELVEAMKSMEEDMASGKFTEEELLEKYEHVLDEFGKEFEPESEAIDEEDADEHPQLLDPYWWRNLRALHMIMITPIGAAHGETRLFAMQMVPDSIPERARPSDRFHVLAFESKKDAEKFCFFMQSKREDEILDDSLRGLTSMTGVGPKELQKIADDANYGVSVIGAGRIDLSPNRDYVDILNDVTHIGGEAYLWEFAKKVKRDFDSANGESSL